MCCLYPFPFLFMRFIPYVDTCRSRPFILNAQYLLRDRWVWLLTVHHSAAVNPCISQALPRVSVGQKLGKASLFLGRKMCASSACASSVLLDPGRMLSKFCQYELSAVVRVPVPQLPPLGITRLQFLPTWWVWNGVTLLIFLTRNSNNSLFLEIIGKWGFLFLLLIPDSACGFNMFVNS